MPYTTPTIGFGFDPKDCIQHFLVVIPKNEEEDVTIYERYKWDDADTQTSELPDGRNGIVRCKLSLTRSRWNEAKQDLERVLNAELKKEKKPTARFVVGQIPVERLLGKEMLVLLWAIENCDKNIIKDEAIKNWEGLSREERWWLYTMTNSVNGDSLSRNGWRSALRYAITNNPSEKSVYKTKALEIIDGRKIVGYYGFGYEPAECMQHFLVVIPRDNSSCYVSVYERFIWDEGKKQYSQLPEKGVSTEDTRCKVKIAREKWELVIESVEEVFNSILKKTNRKQAHFKSGQTPVERLLGKEMMILLWAIEDCDVSVIPTAIRNWQALSREERWWLYTMTNATTGDAYKNKYGWRVALKYALTDNPIYEKKDQLELDLDSSWDGLFKSTN